MRTWRSVGFQFFEAAGHLHVGAQAGERRAQLVGGVEDQLALALPRGVEGLEQPVEGPAEPAQLVDPSRVEALFHVGGLGQFLDGAGQAVERADHCGTDGQAQQDGHGHPDHDDQPQGQGQVPELLVDPGQRGGDLEGAPVAQFPRAVVSPVDGPRGQGHHQLALVDAADRGREVAVGLLVGTVCRALGRRTHRENLGVGRIDRTAGIDHLLAGAGRGAAVQNLGHLAGGEGRQHRLGFGVQGDIDGTDQCVVGHQVGGRRGQDHHHQYRGGGGQHQSAAEGHRCAAWWRGGCLSEFGPGGVPVGAPDLATRGVPTGRVTV